MPVSTPPAFRAAEIALVALKQNRCTSWADLEKRGVDPRLSDGQLQLIHQEMETVSNLQLLTGKPISVTYCPECGRMSYIGAGGVPAKCTLKFGCKGSPIKATSTKKKSVVEEVVDPLALAIAAAEEADRAAAQIAAAAFAIAAASEETIADEGDEDEAIASDESIYEADEEY